MSVTIKRTMVCQISPILFTCEHMGSTIEGIFILKLVVLFFSMKYNVKMNTLFILTGYPTASKSSNCGEKLSGVDAMSIKHK